MTSLESIFPFEPYKIQKELMEKILDTIENSKIGIFESPTGTGKSLSVLSAIVYWLQKDDKTKTNKNGGNDIEDVLPDWVKDFKQEDNIVRTKFSDKTKIGFRQNKKNQIF